ncbi:MAG: hypothetical protein JW749_00130 [Sedimentisphaerales bacterium]|nr:hypothetical protein [Sedimentisphaerales bacterium]
MAGLWVLIWVMTSVTAYFLTEAACLCCSKESWDRPAKEFAAICSILLGPVYLIIAAELAVLSLMGSGLTKGDHKTSRD